jgi:hypothetical protein
LEGSSWIIERLLCQWGRRWKESSWKISKLFLIPLHWKSLFTSFSLSQGHSPKSKKKTLFLKLQIDIWDERKVFGTRIESLKNDILGGSTHTMGNNVNSSNPSPNPSSVSKAARKDSGTVTRKLTVGGMPEKIVTAYQSVLDQHFDEDTALNKCNNAVSVLDRMDKDVDDACTQGKAFFSLQ